MSDTVIQVENLSKKYIIGHQQAGAYQYNALRDVIANGVRSLGHKIRHSRKAIQPANQEEFWALKDVSFEVKRGEVVGIIGRNGAGKSTLLKILSRITEPTTGRIKLKGRVASLLEVGTGFHPELTGRENIFLNGAVLGMSKAEINRQFDEIVEFAEISRFLDTPVKRYSSGMYVRLAFAVAAHLEPEILVVDEVLAVGDAAFQKKCLGKMGSVAQMEGRTVLFVSHQMNAIQHLCNKSLLIEGGKISLKGDTDLIVQQYLLRSKQLTQSLLSSRQDRRGNGHIRLTSLTLYKDEHDSSSVVMTGQNVAILIEYKNNTLQDLRNLKIDIGVNNQYGNRITWLSSDKNSHIFSKIPHKNKQILLHIHHLSLTPGNYSLTIYVEVDGTVADWVQDAFQFNVEAGDFYGNGKLCPPGQGDFLLENYNFTIKGKK